MKIFYLLTLLTGLYNQAFGSELNLSCFNHDGKQSLSIVTSDDSSIEAKLFEYDGLHRAPTLLTTFVGQTQDGDNSQSLFSRVQYQVTDTEGLAALLTIITRPIIGRGGFGRGGCGRALCQPKITASLSYKEVVTQYECF